MKMLCLCGNDELSLFSVGDGWFAQMSSLH